MDAFLALGLLLTLGVGWVLWFVFGTVVSEFFSLFLPPPPPDAELRRHLEELEQRHLGWECKHEVFLRPYKGGVEYWEEQDLLTFDGLTQGKNLAVSISRKIPGSTFHLEIANPVPFYVHQTRDRPDCEMVDRWFSRILSGPSCRHSKGPNLRKKEAADLERHTASAKLRAHQLAVNRARVDFFSRGGLATPDTRSSDGNSNDN